MHKIIIDTINSISTVELILFGSFILCFLIQIFYYLYFYAKPLYYQRRIKRKEISTQPAKTQPGVSVIISAKNESQNLEKFLPYILRQNYENFEVIVVNDGSTDETECVLGAFEQKYKNLYKTYIPEEAKSVSHKKLALSVGIKAAKYDILLFTEANTQPLSKAWIRSMVQHFDDQTEIVLGFSQLNRFGFMSKLANFDNIFFGLRYLSRAISKRPYMGIGSNLAYRKDLFFSKKGYSKHLRLQYGEDDLFVNDFANKKNTKVEISKESVNQTNIESFKIWKEIKVRRGVTQKYYKGFAVGLWRFEYLTRFLLWGLTLAICILFWENIFIPAIAVVLFAIKFIVQYIIINKSAKMFTIGYFTFSLVLFDLLQPLYNIYFYLYRKFTGKNDYI